MTTLRRTPFRLRFERRMLVLLSVVLTVVFASAGTADDHLPPRVSLAIAGRGQEGRLGENSWTSKVGESCSAQHLDVFGRLYPSPRRVDSGRHTARVRFGKPEMPEVVSIRGWTWIEDRGDGRDRRGERSFSYALQPVEENGEVTAWIAEASVRVRRHLYIAVYAEWPDQEGCPQRQSATWHLHLKTRRA